MSEPQHTYGTPESRAYCRDIGALSPDLAWRVIRSMRQEERATIAKTLGLRGRVSMRKIAHHCIRTFEHTRIN